jgi:antirestriction protein
MTTQVYVGTYAKYNNGSIEGAWVDLEGHDEESFYEACRELHKDEADPEFMFQDFEGFPREFYGESSLSENLWHWLEMDEDERELVGAFTDCFGFSGSMDYAELLEKANDAYMGQFGSDEDFADDYIESTGMLDGVPDSLKAYFDTSRFAWDLMYDFSSSNGHYFHNNW